MTDWVERGKLMDKLLACLAFQFRGIQIPVWETRCGGHYNVMRWPPIQTAGQHTIHPTEIMSHICKATRIQTGLQEKQVHGAADVGYFFDGNPDIFCLCTFEKEIRIGPCSFDQ